LAEGRSPAAGSDAILGGAALAQPESLALPAAANWLDPQAPVVNVEGTELLPAVAAPETGTELLPAVRHSAGTDQVLVAGEGDDLVIGLQGADVLVGGIASTATAADYDLAS
jgi:hypothetical protein